MRSISALLLLLSLPLHAASFDCTRSLTKVESMICEDPLLSSADSQLTALYQAARQPNNTIAKSQKYWLEMRNSCDNTKCLIAAYDSRIGHLDAFMQGELKGLDCDYPLSTTEMNYCGSVDTEVVERKMEEAYENQLDLYRPNPQCIESEIDCEGAIAALKQAQGFWLQYRDFHCQYIALQNPYGARGSVQAISATECFITLTIDRRWELSK